MWLLAQTFQPAQVIVSLCDYHVYITKAISWSAVCTYVMWFDFNLV